MIGKEALLDAHESVGEKKPKCAYYHDICSFHEHECEEEKTAAKYAPPTSVLNDQFNWLLRRVSFMSYVNC